MNHISALSFNKALAKDLQKEVSLYKGMYEEKEAELTHKVSEMTATLREMDILKCNHQSLEVCFTFHNIHCTTRVL